MKSTLILFFIFIGFTATAQKSKQLNADDPIVGEWEFKGEEAPELYPGEPHKIIALKSGDQESIIGAYVDPEYGLAGPSYFIALSNGKTISGKLTQTVFLGEEGKEISFDYRYDKENDQLIVIIDKKEYLFGRYQ